MKELEVKDMENVLDSYCLVLSWPWVNLCQGTAMCRY